MKIGIDILGVDEPSKIINFVNNIKTKEQLMGQIKRRTNLIMDRRSKKSITSNQPIKKLNISPVPSTFTTTSLNRLT